MRNENRFFFREALLLWNEKENRRKMPWKGEPDPYKIWISEIILQQTRVEQGWDYYLRFIEAYPTVKDLDSAPEGDVFKLWEGLGYYSRCRNLLAAAREVMELHAGVFPSKHDQILALKGVGPYTAAAIASFAFSLPFAVVDGNVTRVLARFFGIDTPIDSTEGRKFFAALAQELIDVKQPAAYNQAIMDFGATLCKPADPLCPSCPLNSRCKAYAKGQTKVLPIKSKKIIKKTRWFCYWLVKRDDMLLIKERTGKDIWQHLHEFYLFENAEAFEWTNKEIEKEAKKVFGVIPEIVQKSAVYAQQLTHQTIRARFIEMKIDKTAATPQGYKWLPLEEIKKMPFPKIINEFMDNKALAPVLLF